MNASKRLRCPIVFNKPRREARWRSLSVRRIAFVGFEVFAQTGDFLSEHSYLKIGLSYASL